MPHIAISEPTGPGRGGALETMPSLGWTRRGVRASTSYVSIRGRGKEDATETTPNEGGYHSSKQAIYGCYVIHSRSFRNVRAIRVERPITLLRNS